MNGRKLLFRTLDLYREASRIGRRFRRRDEEDEAAARITSGQSWVEFCDALKAAGAAVSGMGAPTDALTQAEGYRYLTRLLRAGLEAFMEYDDPLAPTLRRMVHETVKMGSDNPDNHYLNATISGAHEYRLRGTRGTVHFLGFSTQKGGYGEGGGLPPTGFFDSTQLEVDEQGRFEITVSCEERAGNWLRMEPETGLLIVRQTFLDGEKELPAEITIERVGGDGQPTPDSARRVDAGLERASNLVAGASLLFAKWARGFTRHVNELPRFDPEVSTAAGGDPDIAYYHSYWRIGPDEALVIEATPPTCAHWNFQLNNHWMESLDYRHHPIHINKASARCESDGSVRVIVAHQDPGLPNWISTVGRREGTMCWRWIHAESHPTPRTRLVSVEDLRATHEVS